MASEGHPQPQAILNPTPHLQRQNCSEKGNHLKWETFFLLLTLTLASQKAQSRSCPGQGFTSAIPSSCVLPPPLPPPPTTSGLWRSPGLPGGTTVRPCRGAAPGKSPPCRRCTRGPGGNAATSGRPRSRGTKGAGCFRGVERWGEWAACGDHTELLFGIHLKCRQIKI